MKLENGLPARRKNYGGDFWWPMYAAEEFMSSEEEWRKLFTGGMNRLLTPSGRLSLKCETGSSIWLPNDATLGWIGGISWHDRRCFRAKVSDIKQILGVQPEVEWGIGACEMIATVIAIMIGSLYRDMKRHIILRTDNQNVTEWISKAKTTDGFPNRILRRLIAHLLGQGIDVFP